MSDSTRRRSKMLRLMLAAVALLGIGAAITAAAWEDRVYYEVAANAAEFNIQGAIADEGANWSTFREADTPETALSVTIADMSPNDTRTIWLQLLNAGDLTAYVTGVGGWADDEDECNPSFAINSSDPEIVLAPGTHSQVFELTFTTGSWAGCQDWAGTFAFYALASTDPS